MELTLQNWQWKAFNLEIGRMLTPVRLKAGIHAVTDRIKNLILKIMQAFVVSYTLQASQLIVGVGFYSGSSLISTHGITVPNPSSFSDTDLRNAIVTEVLAYATSQSYSMTADDVVTTISPTGFLQNAPQAAIADCPADAVTNYNVVTTLLGSLTGAVNTANTKQNDIATRLNSLFAELRTLKIIAP